jgi:glycosyltransferase involved in cell wall biosynthesis
MKQIKNFLFIFMFSNMHANMPDTLSLQQDMCAPYIQDEHLVSSVPILNGERHIVVVVCSYNNSEYYQWNLDSILAQEYTNYHVIYVDDCSSDNTFNLVKTYIEGRLEREHFILINNEVRKKALANLYCTINSCKSTDIIAILDGDDRFAHNRVLQKINEAYADPNIWLTFGQFREYPQGNIGFCRPYPPYVVDHNSFRFHPDTPSHLRTFYAGLFHKIRQEDLMFQGDFFSMTYDLAIMFPMIEMARTHHRFIGEVLVDYNNSNPLSDHRVGKGLQRKLDLIIRARPCYSEIPSPF